MKRFLIPAAAIAAAIPLAAPAVTAPAVYTDDGVYAVGNAPRGGLEAYIPPGIYQVRVGSPQQAELGLDFGIWYRCSSVLCGPGYIDNIIATGGASASSAPPVMEVEPTDAAILLSNLRLIRVE